MSDDDDLATLVRPAREVLEELRDLLSTLRLLLEDLRELADKELKARHGREG